MAPVALPASWGPAPYTSDIRPLCLLDVFQVSLFDRDAVPLHLSQLRCPVDADDCASWVQELAAVGSAVDDHITSGDR
jgi:hypothetical protein